VRWMQACGRGPKSSRGRDEWVLHVGCSQHGVGHARTQKRPTEQRRLHLPQLHRQAERVQAEPGWKLRHRTGGVREAGLRHGCETGPSRPPAEPARQSRVNDGGGGGCAGVDPPGWTSGGPWLRLTVTRLRHIRTLR
jgi:hypothetical protein